MPEVQLNIGSDLNEVIAKWEDSLESNYDDFVVIDNEEGDFGIIRYFGADVDGTPNVHLMTKYVHGGDQEESYYTPAGADIVQKLMRLNFETVLRRKLEQNLDPGISGKMEVGFVQAFKEAEEKRISLGKELIAQIHSRYEELFPKELVDGGIYRYGFKYFVVEKVSDEQNAERFTFVNLINSNQALAISPKLIIEQAGSANYQFSGDHSEWLQAFVKGRVVVQALPQLEPQGE